MRRGADVDRRNPDDRRFGKASAEESTQRWQRIRLVSKRREEQGDRVRCPSENEANRGE